MTDAMKYKATLLSRASFPADLEADGQPCIVEVTVYRLNAMALVTFSLDGPESLLQYLGLDAADNFVTQHYVDDIVTVVHIARKEGTP